METDTILSKKEKRIIKRQEKQKAHDESIKKKKQSRFIKRMLWGVCVLAIVGSIGWLITKQSAEQSTQTVSRSGMHWHPELTIYVKGEKIEIPANIGIGMNHLPIHTHDDSDKGVVHMEFQGLVQSDATTLGQFFKNWGKDMRSFGTNMRMTVNGEENTDYEEYKMRDKDQIELFFD